MILALSNLTFVHGFIANPLSSLQALSSPAIKYDLASSLVGLNCSTAHFVGLNKTGPFSKLYNLSKNSSLNDTISKLVTKAENCRLEHFYKDYEFMGKNRRIIRNHCILTFMFEEHIELVSEFIRFVKIVNHQTKI